jgi:hypothetical protein
LLQVYFQESSIETLLTNVNIIAVEPRPTNRLAATYVTFKILMQDVLIDRIFQHVILVNVTFKAFPADISVGFDFWLVAFLSKLNFLLAFVTMNHKFMVDVILTKLVSKRQPTFTEVVISSK